MHKKNVFGTFEIAFQAYFDRRLVLAKEYMPSK